MKTILHLISLCIFLICLVSCGQNMESKVGKSEYAMAPDFALAEAAIAPPNQRNDLASADVPEQSRKLIKEGRIRFETDDLPKTRDRINAVVRAHNAYLSNENEHKYEGVLAHELTIRVPSKNFDQLLAGIAEGVAHFDEKNIQVKDVTEEFLDISARLKTKKELEQRYRELLQKASTVKDILEIEREIGNLRADIESIEGRLRFLTNQVDYSTLTVYYYQPVSGQNRYGTELVQGFRNGWQNLIVFFIALVNIWPFILLTIGTVILIRRLIHRKKSVPTNAWRDSK